jgi:hypothetical protein
MRIEAVGGANGSGAAVQFLGRAGLSQAASSHPLQQTLSVRPNLPRIRFLPDGRISETSPERIRLTGQEGMELWLVQATNRLGYEIRNQNQ